MCLQCKSINHTCNDDDIKFAILIQKDTKCCPNCKTLFFRSQGCDHMFCIICKIGFNWNTCAKITAKGIYNPRQADYLHNNNAEDILCNEPYIVHLHILMLRKYSKFKKTRMMKKIYDVYKMLKYHERTYYYGKDLRQKDQRAEYANGLIDDKKWNNIMKLRYMNELVQNERLAICEA